MNEIRIRIRESAKENLKTVKILLSSVYYTII